MGCSLSCCIRFNTSSESNSIRIIHLNGFVEEIEHPITAAEVSGKPPSHFVFTQAQLLAPAPTPLKLDAQLEPSRVYFLLPFSLFNSNVSPLDLAPLVRKLALIARRNRPSKSPSTTINVNDKVKVGEDSFDQEMSPRNARSWKPVLSTIREKSFDRRESDLHEG